MTILSDECISYFGNSNLLPLAIYNESSKIHCMNPDGMKKVNKQCLLDTPHTVRKSELEDLKVLRRSPDHLNNVKIIQGQLQLIIEQILFYHICSHFGQVT